MNCKLTTIGEADGKTIHVCSRCKTERRTTQTDARKIKVRCGAKHSPPELRVAELFPGEDPTLLGNRIAALTAAIGWPPCGGCTKRKNWLNAAHDWLRGQS